MKSPAAWVRPHVRELTPYSAARAAYDGGDRLYLDANESPYDTAAGDVWAGLHRYPDPACRGLRAALCDRLQVGPERLWLGNGSDEALDLIIRAFVGPGEPVVICTPTYAMYGITARAHAAAVREVALDAEFDLDLSLVSEAAAGSKVVFLCSPNNPTGNHLSRDRVERLVREFDGLVVVDEAYVEFGAEPSLAARVAEHRNLAVLRTLSKAWGLAAARVGYLVADPLVVEYLDRINLPYPLNALSAAVAERALARPDLMSRRVARIVAERRRLAERLTALGLEVFPSDANFLLVRIADAREVHRRLAEEYGIVVRDRSDVSRLENCLRVTVGRPADSDRLCRALEAIRR
jgi:histidinol-phosphate aminotransferase